jgi:hypothetical protein
MLLLALLAATFLLDDLVKRSSLDYAEALFFIVSLAPTILLLVTGKASGVSFFHGLFWGNTGAAQSHFSREKALAFAGHTDKGREAALGMLWRDRVVGDTRAPMAILEMARRDRELLPEAMRAAHRLLANWKLSRHDRDHVGRLISQIRISSAAEVYS